MGGEGESRGGKGEHQFAPDPIPSFPAHPSFFLSLRVIVKKQEVGENRIDRGRKWADRVLGGGQDQQWFLSLILHSLIHSSLRSLHESG